MPSAPRRGDPTAQPPGRSPGFLERLLPRDRRHRARGRSGPRTAVVTDTASAIPAAWAQEHAEHLRVLPLPVMIDGQIYTEGLDDVETALAMALATGASVQTSRPAPGAFQRTYESLAAAGFERIYSLHLSQGLSGTVDAACWAAEQVEVEVTVMDTRTVGLAQGLAVMDAVLAAEAGAGAQELEAGVRRAQDHGLYFVVPSLEQLRKGGRIGAAASMFGTLLAVKPLLAIENGRIGVHEKVRTMPRAMSRLVEISREEAAAAPAGARIAVHYFGNPDQAHELCAELESSSVGDVLCEPLPTVLAAHAGAGVLAVVIAALAPPDNPDEPVDAAAPSEQDPPEDDAPGSTVPA
ncbi:MAG: DegV family protein [Arthrobacter sp.]|uniref:DegV family protein n=1 Tax=unclassified Arthrobacter TaxID=235627 RepID=UPI00264FD179|nr:DegV family protein [Micrococcaceae bacterium]MDN5825038.1 DegV family protein [Micrococcaceae bacterium]MDN5880510.1 DegV family protein [Micrococcaceae bacterium]MDN5887546.1 DegV family protein [Micrococcaceae bacterium]MDN6202465.1 DegV family protein [Micrococcaceae bacterium]